MRTVPVRIQVWLSSHMARFGLVVTISWFAAACDGFAGEIHTAAIKGDVDAIAAALR